MWITFQYIFNENLGLLLLNLGELGGDKNDKNDTQKSLIFYQSKTLFSKQCAVSAV